jgi:integrase/recombinase XerD
MVGTRNATWRVVGIIRKSACWRLCRARHNRHRFAIQTLLRWYRSGDDVERRLPVLSTYLGHVRPDDTYWYLTACPELMGQAVARLEKRWRTPK